MTFDELDKMDTHEVANILTEKRHELIRLKEKKWQMIANILYLQTQIEEEKNKSIDKNV